MTAFDKRAIAKVTRELEEAGPREVIAWALESFGDRLATVTSFQADGLVVLDMAYELRPNIRVITVDTGRLPDETLGYIEVIRARYPEATFHIQRPDPAAVDTMVEEHGLDLFRESVSNRVHCCQVRKVEPLRQALRGHDAWFTGLRRDQSTSRSTIGKVEVDHNHDGMVKVNPLADWSKTEVDEYLASRGVPLHPLYAQGYASIGCAPCTRAIGPDEDERAGRWWWETDAAKECGIHYSPVATDRADHGFPSAVGAIDLRR